MATVTFTFDTNKERAEIACANMAIGMHCALAGIDQFLRNKTKHEDDPSPVYQEVRDELHRIMDEQDVDLFRAV